MSRILGAVLVCGAALVSTLQPAGADDRLWVGHPSQPDDPLDGFFNQAVNWQPQQVPGTSDTALFDVLNSYTVWFDNSPTNQDMHYYSGYLVTLRSAGAQQTYTLTGSAEITASGCMSMNDLRVDIADMLWVNGNPDTRLTIENGAVVTSAYGYIAGYGGAIGEVAVDGSSSNWTATESICVGEGGQGTLTIRNGADVLSWQSSYVGLLAASSGTVTVTGPGSSWTSAGKLSVGYSGAGTLTVGDGGYVNNYRDGYIGADAGSSGEVTVGGNGSSWVNEKSLYIGGTGASAGGVGLLGVEDSGTVEVYGTLKVWPAGALEVDGGGLVVADALERVSGAGVYTLTGSTVRVNALVGFGSAPSFGGHLQIGHSGGSGSGLHAVGAGQSLQVGGNLAVGYDAPGELQVSGSGDVANVNASVGALGGSSGTVTVAGTGSTWQNTGGLCIGDAGSGAMTVSAGGSVTSTTTHIGSQAGSAGIVAIVAADWLVSGYLHVGLSGTGSLAISDDGVVSVDGWTGTLGYESEGEGVVVVEGSGRWIDIDNLYVGRAGTGYMMLQTGGTVSSSYGYVGRYAGADGTVVVDGGGSLWSVADSAWVGGGPAGPGGHGSVTVSNGGAVTLGDTLRIWSDGTLAGHGNVTGNVVNTGGEISPGTSIGTLAVNGDLDLDAASRLNVELGSPSWYDKLTVTGTAALNGTLGISLRGGFTPAAGDEFVVLTAGSRSGEFSDIQGWELPNAIALVEEYEVDRLTLIAAYSGDATLDLCVDGLDYISWSNNYEQSNKLWGDGDFTGEGYVDGLDYVIWSNNYGLGCPGLSVLVPEPATLSLLALGAMALIGRRRRA